MNGVRENVKGWGSEESRGWSSHTITLGKVGVCNANPAGLTGSSGKLPRGLVRDFLRHPGLGKTDWQVPTEVDLQDLCTGVAESEELDGIWTSLFIFVALFLFSVTYGASVTLFKVGHRPSSLDEGRLGDPARQTEPEQRPSRTPSSQVRWVLEAVLQETPQSTHDYVNIMQPEGWTHSTSSTQPGCLLPHV